MGLFLQQDSVDQAAVAGSETAPEAVYAEVRGRGAHGEVGHHVGHAPQHPHCLFSLELPRFDAMACRQWAELKGLSSLAKVESISSNIRSASGVWSRRPWMVSAVSTKGLLTFVSPLAIRTFAYSAAMLVALAWPRPWALANASRRKNDFVDTLQLCLAHGHAVVCHVLAELRRHLEALRLCGMGLEGRRAAEDFAAPLLQNSQPHAVARVSCDGGHHRVARLLWADGAQRTTLSKGRSPSFRETMAL